MKEFRRQFQELMDEAHNTALEKGWWNLSLTFGEQLLLFHAEISEALEEYRSGHSLTEIYYLSTPDGMTSNHTHEKPEGIPIELADLLIRVFDTCAYYNIDLLDAILIKMEYNKTRSFRHGNKKL